MGSRAANRRGAGSRWVRVQRRATLRATHQRAALQQWADGHKHGSMRNLVEQLRQDSGDLVIERDGPYKLDNRHAPFCSRLLMRNEPDLRGFFEIRELRTP